jgi:hypothetical protein
MTEYINEYTGKICRLITYTSETVPYLLVEYENGKQVMEHLANLKLKPNNFQPINK